MDEGVSIKTSKEARPSVTAMRVMGFDMNFVPSMLALFSVAAGFDVFVSESLV